MFLLTPARLRALTWLGAFVTLTLMTEGTCTWAQWSNADSVPQLSDARACELARLAVLTAQQGDCTLVERTPEALHLQVHLGEREPVEVCFLKAGRWFTVDQGARIECPSSPPHPLERIGSWSQEFRLEQRWQESVSGRRQARERTRFRERLTALVHQQQSLEPFGCPGDLPVGDIPSLDAALVVGGEAWHFVSDDELEGMLGSGPRRSDPARRPPALIALVELNDRRLPVQQNPGWARGALVLVDWQDDKVLCKGEVSITQPENAFRDLSRPDMLMPDFKDRVTTGLGHQLAILSGGALTLRPTW